MSNVFADVMGIGADDLIPSLTAAGMGDPGSLEAMVDLAARHGFRGLELGIQHILKATVPKGSDRIRSLLCERNVQIGAVGMPLEWRESEDVFRHWLVRLPEACRLVSGLGCTRMTTWVMPSVQEVGYLFSLEAVKRLRLCAEILNAFGIKLCLEFVAPNHLRNLHPYPFIRNQVDLLELIYAIDRPSVGLLLDSFHWYCSGGSEQELEELPLEYIAHVHLGDAPPGPVDQLLDNDRLFPGEGVIDINAFLSVLRRRGYEGFVALEVLTPHPPDSPPEVMAAKASATMLPFFS